MGKTMGYSDRIQHDTIPPGVFMGKTIDEVNEDLTAVRAAIRAAETAQSYTTGLGHTKMMANLTVLYKRETDLLAVRDSLLSGGKSAGPVWNRGVINRG
jgi:hypothetical protein